MTHDGLKQRRATVAAQSTLAAVAQDHKIDLSTVIDPVALAVELHLKANVPVKDAAALCGVGRTALHRKINQVRDAS